MKFQAVVKEVLQETPKVRLVRFAWPGVEQFSFRPGQWVGVWCDEFLAGNGKPLRRAFSIASCPNGSFLELCIARGLGLSKHLQDLDEGSFVWFDGPYGMFWLKPAEKYLFIAGGTGIAPFMPMISQALGEGKEVLLIYSIKTPSDFIYRKELEAIKNPKFKMVATLTSVDFPVWEGERGRVQTFLSKYFKRGFEAYVCGPPAMVESVASELSRLGQPKDKVYLDKWE